MARDIQKYDLMRPVNTTICRGLVRSQNVCSRIGANIRIYLTIGFLLAAALVEPAATQAPRQTSAVPAAPAAENAIEDLLAGKFHWTVGDPLLATRPENLPPEPADNPWVAVKDPSIVHHEGRWHLFCSLRKKLGGQGRICIGYLSFTEWKEAPAARWHLLKLTDDYHGAPQIFYFPCARRRPPIETTMSYKVSPSSTISACRASFGKTTPREFPIFRTLVSMVIESFLFCNNKCYHADADLQVPQGEATLLSHAGSWQILPIGFAGDRSVASP